VIPVVLGQHGASAEASTVDELKPTEHPFLWRIEHPSTQKASWLFGTVHVGHPAVLEMHEAVEKAHAEADAVYCELKMDTHSMMKMQLAVASDDKRPLSERLPEAAYKKLKAFLAKRGIPVEALKGMRLWAIEMQAGMLDEIELIGTSALDKRLYETARLAKKEVGGIEKLEEQFAIFDSMSLEDQIESLCKTLDETDKAVAEGRQPLREVLSVYLSGDAEKLLAKMYEDYDPEDPKEVAKMKLLLDDRNVRMADRSAEKVLASPTRSFFFAYGTAHMPGKVGVIELLRKKGFTVTRIGAPEKVSSRGLVPAR